KPVGADERDAARPEAATAGSDLGRQDATADVEPGIRDEDEGERTAPDAGAPKQSEPASGPVPPAPPPPAERAGGRFWPGFVGAVVGAAVGAAAVWLILEQ